MVALSRRHIIDPTLNLEKILQVGQLARNLTHISREPWTFCPNRNEPCSLFINGVICKKPPWKIKNCISSKQNGMQTGNSQVYTLENYHVIRETCYSGNFLVCHAKNWGTS